MLSLVPMSAAVHIVERSYKVDIALIILVIVAILVMYLVRNHTAKLLQIDRNKWRAEAINGRARITHLERVLARVRVEKNNAWALLAKKSLEVLKLIEGGIQIVAESFAKDSFWKQDGPVKLYFWGNFEKLVLKAIPDAIPAFSGMLMKTMLTKQMWDSEILAELQNPTPFTIAELAAILLNLLMNQPNGEEGILLKNGYANIFYAQLEDGRVVAVSVRWDSDDCEWRCDASDLATNVRWDIGDCVFFRS